jgi:hypothetical protein
LLDVETLAMFAVGADDAIALINRLLPVLFTVFKYL